MSNANASEAPKFHRVGANDRLHGRRLGYDVWVGNVHVGHVAEWLPGHGRGWFIRHADGTAYKTVATRAQAVAALVSL